VAGSVCAVAVVNLIFCLQLIGSVTKKGVSAINPFSRSAILRTRAIAQFLPPRYNSPGMPQEILSLAVWKPVPEMEAASLATFRELKSIVAAKGYGRDLLYRDRGGHYVFLRYWKSEEARRAAQEDPDMLRCWARLGNEIQIVRVYETLTEMPLEQTK
jgi:hypothetical protein